MLFFAPVTELYKRKYNIFEDRINNKTPKIVFDMENPLVVAQELLDSEYEKDDVIDLIKIIKNRIKL